MIGSIRVRSSILFAAVLAAGAVAEEEQSWAAFAAMTAAQAPAVPVPGYEHITRLLEAGRAGEYDFAEWNIPRAEGVEELPDVEYGTRNGVPVLLDVFRPTPFPEGMELPAVVFVHGGGWRQQSRKDIRHFAMALAQAGFVTLSIDYRLSGVAPYPAAIVDVRCALRWFRAHAADYGADRTRVGIMGASAGAHLALLAAYAAPGEYDDADCHPGESAAVQAVAALYPPTDFTRGDIDAVEAVQNFLGGTAAERPEVYKAASPLSHVSAAAPPTLLMHGSSDRIVPVAHSDQLAARLDTHAVPSLYDRISGWPHGMDFSVAVRDRCIHFMTAFFRRTLAGTPVAAGAPDALPR